MCTSSIERFNLPLQPNRSMQCQPCDANEKKLEKDVENSGKVQPFCNLEVFRSLSEVTGLTVTPFCSMSAMRHQWLTSYVIRHEFRRDSLEKKQKFQLTLVSPCFFQWFPGASRRLFLVKASKLGGYKMNIHLRVYEFFSRPIKCTVTCAMKREIIAWD